ncbi:hypothetical protein PSCICN_40160 [Pseudomonas cichorii]|uniref:hypothetical protein n=1 Tax=Pseudomonas cichorii TaxID=36746 RepID=UPI0019108163|nr:hypothetical protein [Pseudomonas cichorii]GFM83324.1 hypothetical protein PSCICN_40160 [Pseudomonas cichorii]
MEWTSRKSNCPFIQELLDAWLKAVKRYVDMLDNDNCWWHNERANVSTLAGAAWSLGWVALEEYPTRKHRPANSDIDKPETDGRGRCDLYISNEHEDFAFEAKHAWQLVGGPDVVKAAMVLARRDALALKREASRHFAATFIVPFLPKAQVQGMTGDDLLGQLKQWLHSQNEFNGDKQQNISYACTFSGTGKESWSNDINHFPGVVLVLEEVHVATQDKNQPFKD